MAENTAHQRTRLLLVDDSRVMRKAITRALEPDFDLVQTEDGEAGWRALRDDPAIALVISDMEMPLLDGHGLLARIRAAEEPRLRALPVIVITGAEDEPARSKAYASGATDVIVKPVDREQLRARLRAHLPSDAPAPSARVGGSARPRAPARAADAEMASVAAPAESKDPLTQLWNRRHLVKRGAEAVAFAERHGQPFTLLLIEIDGFKSIYRLHGDQNTDIMLREFAKMLIMTCRREDAVGRVSGTLFAVLCPGTAEAAGRVLAERIRIAAEATVFAAASTRVPITVSVGLSAWSPTAASIDALLDAARAELRAAQKAGGNRIAPGSGPSCAQTSVALPEPLSEPPPDLEAALAMIAQGETEHLRPHLPAVAIKALLLIEACNLDLDLGLGFAIDALRNGLTKAGRS